jgi:hypothetical protein
VLQRSGFLAFVLALALCGVARADTVTSWARFSTGERPTDGLGVDVDGPAAAYPPQWQATCSRSGR